MIIRQKYLDALTSFQDTDLVKVCLLYTSDAADDALLV